MRAPVKSAYVTRFFQLITTKQLTEAERELQRIKEKIERTEWNHGYFKALQGMLLARRNSNDPNSTFLSMIDPNDKHTLLQLKREFQGIVESRLYTDYDRGYFSAWTDYVSVLRRMNLKTVNPSQSPQPSRASEAESSTQQAQASLTSWQNQSDQ